jgi:hypothetical protein
MCFGLISDAKKGVSALQLLRNLGITPKTAWKMYHQVREIMSDDLPLQQNPKGCSFIHLRIFHDKFAVMIIFDDSFCQS